MTCVAKDTAEGFQLLMLLPLSYFTSAKLMILRPSPPRTSTAKVPGKCSFYTSGSFL